MKGFGMLEKGKAGMLEKPDPVIKNPTDAIIKVTAVAPCTSDVHLIQNPMFEGMMGNFIGHEAVGVVHEVGPGVKDFKVGDRVAISDISPDWTSFEAQNGMPHYSPGSSRTQRLDMQGMFSEYLLFERADDGLAHIPDNVTDEQAVMAVDMIATVAAAAEFLDIKHGDTVAVLGIGPVGLMGVEWLAISGAARIFASGSRPSCFEAAKKLGATDLINYKDGSIAEQILAKNGRPVDKVLICGGNSDIVQDAYRICKHGGKIANVAVFFDVSSANATIPNFDKTDKAFCTFQVTGGRYVVERFLALIQYGRLHPEHIVSHVLHGFESIPEAFEMMSNKDAEMIKPVVIL